MSTINFLPDLSGAGRPAGGGVGDAMVTSAGMRTDTAMGEGQEVTPAGQGTGQS
jgi:hypothetical protein